MKKMTYEQAVAQLEEIVKQMESGALPLDESIKLFEEGTKLSAYCAKCLDEAEQKITLLTSAEEEE